MKKYKRHNSQRQRHSKIYNDKVNALLKLLDVIYKDKDYEDRDYPEMMSWWIPIIKKKKLTISDLNMMIGGANEIISILEKFKRESKFSWQTWKELMEMPALLLCMNEVMVEYR